MPHRTYDTTTPTLAQAAADQQDDWNREVVARLPENLQQQARVLKAFERSRQIRSASDLLRGLLAYVYTVHSFEHLSIWSVLLGVADVSANAWRKRLQGASAWQSPAVARSAGRLQRRLAVAGARRVAAYLVDRWHPSDLSRSAGHGLAGAYGL